MNILKNELVGTIYYKYVGNNIEREVTDQTDKEREQRKHIHIVVTNKHEVNHQCISYSSKVTIVFLLVILCRLHRDICILVFMMHGR